MIFKIQIYKFKKTKNRENIVKFKKKYFLCLVFNN